MSTSNPFETFELALAESVIDVFAHVPGDLELEDSRSPVPGDADIVFASIGFASTQSRGALTLIASPRVVQAMRPPELEDCDEVTDCDVLGEMANMLMGRLKIYFLKREVALMIGVPHSATARDIRFEKPKGVTSAWYVADLEAGQFHVMLEAGFDPDFAMKEPQIDSAEPAPGDNDMMFF